MRKNKGSFIYLAAALSAAFIWGFLTIPLKRLHQIGYLSEQILYYRVLTSFVLIWSFNLPFRRKAIKADIGILKTMPPAELKKALWLLLATGIFITANWFTYIYVVNHIGVKVAGFGYLICPLITAAGGFMILKEPLSRIKVVGVVTAIISIGILSTGSISQALWSVLVAISYSIYLIIQRVLTQFDKINMLAFQLVIATLILLPFFIYQFKGFPKSAEFWITIIIVAVVFTLIPLLLSLFALTGIPSSTLGITIYINPVMTFAVAFFYFHESFEKSQLTGYLLLLASVIVFNWEMMSGLYNRSKSLRTQLS